MREQYIIPYLVSINSVHYLYIVKTEVHPQLVSTGLQDMV